MEIELECIRRGGIWQKKNGDWAGGGLAAHFKALQSCICPWKKWDRWSELILSRLVKNRVTVLTGPASSTKTHNAAFYAFCRYMARPNKQLVLVSSTDSRSLELRIWGEIKKLWAEAKNIAPDWVPGRIIESRQMIVTDRDDLAATDYRAGIIGVPVVSGGAYVGMSKLVGFKNENLLLVADELSYMPVAFFDVISNLSKNHGFQVIGIGNPKDRTDTLGKLAEPASEIGGWEGYAPTGKTYIYPTRISGGEVIVLDGRDTPNNGTLVDGKWAYKHIINPDQIAKDIELYGEDSIQVSMMDYGIFPRDAQSKRVINRTLCEKFRAFEDAVWSHEPLTKIVSIDAAYGATGGDRCVLVELAFGKCTDGVTRLAFAEQPMVVPVTVASVETPEDQITTWVKDYCMTRDIPPSNVGFDSTGRGSLVSSFGRLWSTSVVPVEFGGVASERPVSAKIQSLCREYYLNFVSELWYQWRHLVEADQLRQFPVSAFDEFCMRAWDVTKGNRIFVEPKAETKLRMGKSPDIADACVVGLELARRLGFQIAGKTKVIASERKWITDLLAQQHKLRSKFALKYAK